MSLNRVVFYLSDDEYAALTKRHMDGKENFLSTSFNEYAKFTLLEKLGKWTRPKGYSIGKRAKNSLKN